MLPDLHFNGGKTVWTDARRLTREGLAQALVEARNRTLAWLAAFGQTRRGWESAAAGFCEPAALDAGSCRLACRMVVPARCAHAGA
ncbi:hypothetical protein ACU4GD_02485 [Cupriavidus basilensis]